MYLLGLDIGTSVIKAALISPEGKVITISQADCPLHHPKTNWNELNPDEVWKQTEKCILNALNRSHVEGQDVEGLSLSVLGEAVTPVDSNGQWLYPAIEPWDKRGDAYRNEIKLLSDRIGVLRLFQITGLPLTPIVSLNKILWIRENMPSIYQKTAKFLCIEEYLIWRFTGRMATDYSLAARTMLLDVRKRNWSQEIIDELNIDSDLLPNPFPSGTPVGEVTREVSQETGLSTKTVVSTGGHDQSCGALGVGLLKEGPVIESAGSTECIGTVTSTPCLSENMLSKAHNSSCYVKKGMYITLGSFPSGGWTLKWFRDSFAYEEKQIAEKEGTSVYSILDREASLSPPGSSKIFFLPHLAGSGTGQYPAMNPYSRGAFLGLHLTHTRNDFVRAIFEGLTFELRQVIESFEEAGLKVDELRSVGGGANSPFWLQLKANITRKRVMVPENREAAAMGAGILAGVGCGIFRDVDEGAEKIYREQIVYTPKEEAETYDRYYVEYRRIYPTLVDLFNRFNEL